LGIGLEAKSEGGVKKAWKNKNHEKTFPKGAKAGGRGDASSGT